MEEEKIYSVTLADGTVISDLKLNGNNFVSQVEISPDIFEDNTYEVKISDGETVEVHTNMELVQVAHYSDGWYFILRELSETELANIKTQSLIEYIAMMTGVEL